MKMETLAVHGGYEPDATTKAVAASGASSGSGRAVRSKILARNARDRSMNRPNTTKSRKALP